MAIIASMWILGVVIIIVMVLCVASIFLGGGEQGPFLSLSKLGSRNRITTTRGQTDFQGDLRKPRNENELL
jgi:hypothetical protein